MDVGNKENSLEGLRSVFFNPRTPESASMGHPSRGWGFITAVESGS